MKRLKAIARKWGRILVYPWRAYRVIRNLLEGGHAVESAFQGAQGTLVFKTLLFIDGDISNFLPPPPSEPQARQWYVACLAQHQQEVREFLLALRRHGLFWENAAATGLVGAGLAPMYYAYQHEQPLALFFTTLSWLYGLLFKQQAGRLLLGALWKTMRWLALKKPLPA